MNDPSLHIAAALKRLSKNSHDEMAFRRTVCEAAEAILPGAEVIMEKDARRNEAGRNTGKRRQFDISAGNTSYLLSVSCEEWNDSLTTACALLAGCVSAVLGLHNEQELSDRLSSMLNAEIDRHHETREKLAREQSAKSGFEREIAEYSRKITEAIVETQEMERRRFARDLHDGIGNTLSMAKLMISSLMQEWIHAHPGQLETMNKTVLLLDSAVRESRQLSRSLTSEMLIEHGLIPTLKEMIARINVSNSLRAGLQVFGITHPLPKHIEQNLFRIIQELINNILKHAEAAEFTVQCIQHADSLIVMVEDDGKGLDLNDPDISFKGMGFANIRTRLKVLDGSMAIDSAPGRGTVVTLDIPFSTMPHTPGAGVR